MSVDCRGGWVGPPRPRWRVDIEMSPAMLAIMESEFHGWDVWAWRITKRCIDDDILLPFDSKRIGLPHNAHYTANPAMGLKAASTVTKSIRIRSVRIDAEFDLSTVTGPLKVHH